MYMVRAARQNSIATAGTNFTKLATSLCLKRRKSDSFPSYVPGALSLRAFFPLGRRLKRKCLADLLTAHGQKSPTQWITEINWAGERGQRLTLSLS